MKGVKEQVIQMIQNLPEDVSVEDIMAELYFRLQVDAGLEELDVRPKNGESASGVKGKGIPHEEVEKRMSKWLNR